MTSADISDNTTISGNPAPSRLSTPAGTSGRRRTTDLVMRVLTWCAGTVAILALGWILGTVVWKGAPYLVSTEPAYTRVCTTAASASDRFHEPYQRVSESQCPNNGGSYRWLQGGVYPAVGQLLPQTASSVSRDPASVAGAGQLTVGAPSSDAAGTIRLPSASWWTQDVGDTPDQRPGGGALHAIVGTLWIGLITTVIAVPLGVMGAIYLVEYARGRRAAKVVSFMVDILTGIPSIVAALFMFAVLISTLGFGRSTIAASLALVLLMLPTVLRSTEEMLKLVPDTLREASYALGVPRWKTIVSVVLPTARSGIGTGIVLGMARVMGETAPLLILLNYARNLNLSPTSRTMGSLPTMIANAAALPSNYPGAGRGWGAALTLILLVMGLNLIARAIGRNRLDRPTRRRLFNRAPRAAAVPAAAAGTSADSPLSPVSSLDADAASDPSSATSKDDA